MSKTTPGINSAMLDLFRMETENQLRIMASSLAGHHDRADKQKLLNSLLAAIRSIKSAARLVNIEPAIRLAAALEESLVKQHATATDVDDTTLSSINESLQLLETLARLDAEQLAAPEPALEQQLSLLISRLGTSTMPAATNSEPTQNRTDTGEDISFTLPAGIDPSMFDLLRVDMDNNIQVLAEGILELEQHPDDAEQLEKMMRASHSIKGAARMVAIDALVKLAHAMEDCFVAAQQRRIRIDEHCTNVILHSIDLLKDMASQNVQDIADWISHNTPQLSSTIHQLHDLQNAATGVTPPPVAPQQTAVEPQDKTPAFTAGEHTKDMTHDGVVRVSARRINRLMGLAGELSITAGWIRTHADSMLNLKKKHNELLDVIDRLRTVLERHKLTDLEHALIDSLQHKAGQYRDNLSTKLLDLDEFDRRANALTSNLNHEIIASRMRPFSDGTQGYKRMVRDIAQSLNKKVRLDIIGEHTQVDREILEKIDAPINHMIRNAIDHGIESPAERIQAGKPETGVIRLEASHNGGQLLVSVSDDGRGVDIETIRSKVLERKLVSKTMADKLSRSELLDFLFLPAFSTRDQVTEISGRGVGLDVVHDTLQALRGKIHASTELGKGMQISMILPLTLSVIRSLMVRINRELYAFPLANIHNLVRIHHSDISVLDDRQYITLNDQHIGLIHCAQILGMQYTHHDTELSVVIIGDWQNLYGVVVDEMLGERALALRPLNARLGKIKDINAAALTDDGEPVLVLDTDDLIASIRSIISGNSIIKVGQDQHTVAGSARRVLVVDDSLTVREVEKKLIESRGYRVDVAVDGVDAWNIVRSGDYDLVVTDVDMPRMNGIELVTLIKADAALRATPVMMVSYKDRPEDKQKGLEAGADYYLTKGSFHDETLIDAVRDLIGDAT